MCPLPRAAVRTARWFRPRPAASARSPSCAAGTEAFRRI
jgi:hypothetical protein